MTTQITLTGSTPNWSHPSGQCLRHMGSMGFSIPFFFPETLAFTNRPSIYMTWRIWLNIRMSFLKPLVAQTVQETQVWSLGQEYPLEKEKATHSSILALETLWTQEPGGLQSMGSQSWIQLSDCEHTGCWWPSFSGFYFTFPPLEIYTHIW